MALFLLRDLLDDDAIYHPTLTNRHAGLGLTPEDLLSTVVLPTSRSLRRGGYYRPWAMNTQDAGSVVKREANQFQVNLDVQQFKPEEISVKVVDRNVIVEGKHEERQDEHGYISRQFVRRYVLPEEYELKNIKSSLSSDGVLTITAPKCVSTETQERVIPITHTGPHNAVKEEEVKDTKEEEKK